MAYTHMGEPTPVTLISGYLGSGKTTLVNHLIATSGERLAVVVNEFGEIDIDGELVLNVEGETMTLANGCICCQTREDLVEVIEDLLERRSAFDRIVIESSGVAEPGPAVMALLSHPDVDERFRLDGVVAVADALHVAQQLERSVEARNQIAYADLVLLNKIDLVDEAALSAASVAIEAINPLAPIRRMRDGVVDAYEILDIGGYDPSRLSEIVLGAHHHSHDEVGAASIEIEGDLDGEHVDRWLHEFVERRHADIYRMKGILSLRDQPRRYVVQGVHSLYNWRYGDAWGDRRRSSRLVVIGRGIDRDEVRDGLLATASKPG